MNLTRRDAQRLQAIRQDRLAKLERLRARGIDAYPARAHRTHTTAEALAILVSWPGPSAPLGGEPITLCGRIVLLRVMGKVTFAHIDDGKGRLQIFLSAEPEGLDPQAYQHFKSDVDIGDFIGVEGQLFYTKTGEPTLRVSSWDLLAKSLRPLPEKWHGLRDVETRYRQRYLDLLANPAARGVFETRTRLMSAIRRFLDARGFLEVETPILQPLYGGAAARPFTTHHHVLDQELYLRISDELYLKRLIIGGLEKVYEIGKDFRNEGVSSRNNPEFTQIEAYQAYADYRDMMALVEECFADAAQEVLNSTTISYQGNAIDLAPPWQRIPLQRAIRDSIGIDLQAAPDLESLRREVERGGLEIDIKPNWGRTVEEILKEFVEPRLIQPTFIIDYPLEISPLAKTMREAPQWVERFEFFIGGLECGNAFSELNDPLEQRRRFEEQSRFRAAGDEEAHPLDEDYLRALEYGMPPTGGVGWGIDRMAMLFTDQASVREVILFPHLRTP
ncbi:MAG: lysine--tRNA ligase [Chloroflexi bacterium]|nr:lysine--tRNA ligase [Chloroflexota bacterium]